jgi:hypothetical protein
MLEKYDDAVGLSSHVFVFVCSDFYISVDDPSWKQINGNCLAVYTLSHVLSEFMTHNQLQLVSLEASMVSTTSKEITMYIPENDQVY